ncbi:MAG: membrane dipeptidase [Acidobacteriales bacterium]|nr:membrane dipeptidase [Terriglobales bacterium]
MDRRRALKGLTLLAGAPFVLRGRYPLFAWSPETYSARCIELVRRSLVVDLLSQFKLGAFTDVLGGQPVVPWFSKPETFSAADLQRYKDSGINIFHIGWGTPRGDPLEGALRVLEAWERFILFHKKDFQFVLRAGDFVSVKHSGRIGILFGLQGADHFRTVEDVDAFHARGQRISQLTYNDQNRIGAGFMARPDKGLASFGREIIARMNKTGMAVDVSHCGDRTTQEAIDVSAKPVLITHTACRALNPHPRCKTDEQIRQLVAKGGVMGITHVAKFAKRGGGATIEDVLDHIGHVRKLVGVERVAIGSDIDLDGYDELPPALRRRMMSGFKRKEFDKEDIPGLDHPKRMFDLTEGLIRRGYSDEEIGLVLGGNAVRVLSEIWKV